MQKTKIGKCFVTLEINKKTSLKIVQVYAQNHHTHDSSIVSVMTETLTHIEAPI